MRASVAAGMVCVAHQQGAGGRPVLRASTSAQRLLWPHSGHWRGSGAPGGGDAVGVVGRAAVKASGMGHGIAFCNRVKQ